MNALEITGLHKTYKNGVHALRGIDLSIRENDFFALLGPNGAGKSTTIGCISALLKPSGGAIEILGHDVVRDGVKARQRLGVVPGDPVILERPLDRRRASVAGVINVAHVQYPSGPAFASGT